MKKRYTDVLRTVADKRIFDTRTRRSTRFLLLTYIDGSYFDRDFYFYPYTHVVEAQVVC